MNQSGRHSRYQVYMLRLWQEPGDASEHSTFWRFVLEEPKTGQRRGFVEFKALVSFLEKELRRQEAIEEKD